MKKFHYVWMAVVVCLTACNNQPGQSTDCQQTIDSLKGVIAADHSSEAAALAAADEAWSKASEEKGAEGFLSYYAEGVTILPPNGQIMTDRAAVEKNVKDMFSAPDTKVKWKSTKVEVSRSGDLGYILGNYEVSWKDKKGKMMTELGKYSEVWKKQSDGNWKAIVDMWSPDPAK